MVYFLNIIWNTLKMYTINVWLSIHQEIKQNYETYWIIPKLRPNKTSQKGPPRNSRLVDLNTNVSLVTVQMTELKARDFQIEYKNHTQHYKYKKEKID